MDVLCIVKMRESLQRISMVRQDDERYTYTKQIMQGRKLESRVRDAFLRQRCKG